MRYGRWAVAAVALLVVAVAVAAAERAPSPHYEMEIRRTANGVELKCRSGCDWIKLTGDCDSKNPACFFLVDQRGIRVLPEP